MIRKIIFVLAAFCIVQFSSSASIDCDSDRCKLIANFYEDIGCKAIKTPKSCCPKRFECPDFKKSDDDTVSHIKQGCLPVFSKDKNSPVDWKCPEVKTISEEVKKIVKRSSPSGNQESYLSEVRKLDDDETTVQYNSNDFESSTTTPIVVTLSTDPFVAPFDLYKESTVSVFVQNQDDKITTAQFRQHTETPLITEALTTTTTQPTEVKIIEGYAKSEENPSVEVKSFLETSSVMEDTTLPMELSTFTTTTEQVKVTETTPKSKIEEIVKEFQKVLDGESTFMATTLPEISTTSSTEKIVEVTTTTSTSSPVQARGLDLFPRALSQSPSRPVAHSTSPETVKTTPSELSSILATLRDIVAKVESLTTESVKDSMSLPITDVPLMTEKSPNEDVDVGRRFKRSIIEEIKQKISPSKVCSFNGDLFKVGEVITTVEDECLECLCEYAPIAHCIIKEHCSV